MTIQQGSPFLLIQLLLSITAITCLLNLSISTQTKHKDEFIKVITAFSLFVFFHAIYVLSIETFLPRQRWLDQMMPFIFVYGPFQYFAVQASIGEIPKTKVIVLHLSPFIFFLCLFGITAINGWHTNRDIYRPIMKANGLISVCSILGYTFYCLISVRTKIANALRFQRSIIIMAGMILIFIGIFFLTINLSRTTLDKSANSAYALRMTVYSCMLLACLMVSAYLFKKPKITQDSIDGEEQRPVYSKSKVPDLKLEEYKILLEKLMAEDQLFLDPSLSLNKLAAKLKLPAHHLTQTLNIKMGSSFTSYINKFRIEHAKRLIINNPKNPYSIDQLAEQCGFNSKISFTRNFKALTGKTPSTFNEGRSSTSDQET